MRERLKIRELLAILLRITPAYAGKTIGYDNVCRRDQDHPRVCGKDAALSAGRLAVQGSPPRMRERHLCGDGRRPANRITPAYAGKTFSGGVKNSWSKDHPRVCGKDWALQAKDGSCRGSPPRMRERPILPQHAIKRPRITPAYAGKTSGSPDMGNKSQDHPRVCGKDTV